MKDYIGNLLDDIERILKRDSKTLGDLARELGRSYVQVYDWLRKRKFNPSAKSMLELQSWRDRNLSGGTVPSRRMNTLRGTQQTE